MSNPLPTDPEEFARATKGWYWLARPAVKGYSKLLETGLFDLVEREALDDEEKELGLQAVSACIYQLGGLADWRVLMLMFIGSTVTPRAAKRQMRRVQERATRAPAVERTVTEAMNNATTRPPHAPPPAAEVPRAA